MAPPAAVLLDVGGIFQVPDHDRISGALARAECEVEGVDLDAAHYHGAAAITTDLDAAADWPGCWRRYLEQYVDACGVAAADRAECHRHLDSEFADAQLWSRVIPGCRDGLGALVATGVRLGVVSNADGLVASRLAEVELLQVGPGPGAAVECVIDSGAVGVMKPDPRIFVLALDAMGLTPSECWYVGDTPGIDVVGARRAGLHPVLMDPLGLHHDADFERCGSLTEVAARVARA
jgi:putative hydrolase of the HAD superfamily